MVSQEKEHVWNEEIVIDFSNIPLVPTSKKEIQELEMALIIATLYSPEVLELIRDPIERATWVDSLAVAAAALARHKAGYPISKIAEEVGRSETMVRAHLSGKTKAGKLVLETYEKLKKGQLKIVVPFMKVPREMAARVQELEEEIARIKKEYDEKIKKLHDEIARLEKEKEELRNKLEEQEKIINMVKEKLQPLKELVELLDKTQ